ncbi:MAG: chemotaxis-specific protein-glutamate methyltransferase CheB [Silicimonas sp.]|nr:chemotaxis-specific protein-glutamate methyltransferase CheB [Silicimonas sp.]
MTDRYSRPVRVLIVDDTRTIRSMIRALLGKSNRIEVVGEAADPYEARELIRELNPDAITLDVVMPRMDGLSFLEHLMRLRPMPVVMVSSRTTENSAEAITALALGAFDCVDMATLTQGTAAVDLADTVLAAVDSNSKRPTFKPRGSAPETTATSLQWNGRVVVIGSSTGGVDALLTVLSNYPPDGPPTVIAQHMPASFLESFARRLDANVAPRVRLAKHGVLLEQGVVYLAPGGDTHVALAPGRPFRLDLVPDDGSEPYIPSVDALFSSAIAHGRHVVGVMLTGMGRDGARQMLLMRQAGTHTIAQDGASATVDGMPKAARDNGAAVEVARLEAIGRSILDQVTVPLREPAT